MNEKSISEMGAGTARSEVGAGTARPAGIDVLLPTWRPHPDYLRRQLRSLEAQDYPDVRLLLLDDSADPTQFDKIRAICGEELHRLPYSVHCNQENIGVRRSLEKLIGLADAALVAPCDQDDIWAPGKLSALAALLEPGVSLSYCNLSILDAQGRTTHPTLQHLRGRFTHRHGPGLFVYFLTDNCVTGMSLLMPLDVARRALPFPEAYVHDHWLALCAAAEGPIAYTAEPLVGYRLHGGNQIGMASLSGVTDVSSYVEKRMLPLRDMLDCRELSKFVEPAQVAEIHRQRQAVAARIRFLQTRRGWPAMARQCIRDPVRLAFETLLGILPRRLGENVVRFGKNH